MTTEKQLGLLRDMAAVYSLELVEESVFDSEKSFRFVPTEYCWDLWGKYLEIDDAYLAEIEGMDGTAQDQTAERDFFRVVNCEFGFVTIREASDGGTDLFLDLDAPAEVLDLFGVREDAAEELAACAEAEREFAMEWG